jgi:hypothetical protein
LGIGDWGLGPIPNPQSPIPNPQSPIPNILIFLNYFISILFFNKINYFKLLFIFLLNFSYIYLMISRCEKNNYCPNYESKDIKESK